MTELTARQEEILLHLAEITSRRIDAIEGVISAATLPQMELWCGRLESYNAKESELSREFLAIERAK